MKKKAGKDLIRQLRERMGEVTELRAARWLEEIDRSPRRSPKERLILRMEGINEKLVRRWLCELDSRLLWPQYREEHDDFCYGLGFGTCEECNGVKIQEPCPSYHNCKAEYEAEWPEKKLHD